MAAVPGSAASEAPASEASEGDRRAVASAFVETRRIGEGRPTPPEHDSALGYHSTRKEAHPAKAGTLPPPTRFAATSAKLVPSPGSTNPYSLGSVYGRGAQGRHDAVPGLVLGRLWTPARDLWHGRIWQLRARLTRAGLAGRGTTRRRTEPFRADDGQRDSQGRVQVSGAMVTAPRGAVHGSAVFLVRSAGPVLVAYGV